MKLIQIGTKLINLDTVIIVDLKLSLLKLRDNIDIELSKEDIDLFVKQYNLYDTDETKLLLERVSKVVTTNPKYLTKDGIREQLTIKVKYYNLESEFKDLSEGKKMKELSISQLISIYKEIESKIEEIEKDMGF